MGSLRVALAQINPTVGDLVGNAELIRTAISEAKSKHCDVVVLPELCVTGYPPEDLLHKQSFLDQAEAVVDSLALETQGITVILGSVVNAHRVGLSMHDVRDARQVGLSQPAALANVAAVLRDGRLEQLVPKCLLPNYAVFDEQRWFLPGTGASPLLLLGGLRLGIVVCEDLWSDLGPVASLREQGLDAIISINASPFAQGHQPKREAIARERARETNSDILYVNQVGGQDELVFDGGSFVVTKQGETVARAKTFATDLLVVEIGDHRSSEVELHGVPDSLQSSYDALVLGTRDYLKKNGFTKVLIGLSGGIDSALVTTIAADAIGASQVRCIAMPSRYSSDHSIVDAQDVSDRVGVSLEIIGIEEAHQAYESMLCAALGEPPVGLTEENLQSRLRGVLLMGISNATGAIVLTTGNKSELATGYSTLYGDSAGGFAVIKDVPKTLVYQLVRYRNERALERGQRPPIPESILNKAPSAELRPDQRDEDSLPPYDVLDPILAGYIEDDLSIDDLVARGFDADVVARVCRLVDIAEYKRRQMPPGPRITSKAFGKDRRMPITNGFRS